MLDIFLEHRKPRGPLFGAFVHFREFSQQLFYETMLFKCFEGDVVSFVRLFQLGINDRFFDVGVDIEFSLELSEEQAEILGTRMEEAKNKELKAAAAG